MQITSAERHSCSGQTPDIAWEKFQKKHCSRTKTWHGKRLSCKIDGVEVDLSTFNLELFFALHAIKKGCCDSVSSSTVMNVNLLSA